MTLEIEQIEACIQAAKTHLEKIEAALERGDYDAADAERVAAESELIEVIHLGPDDFDRSYTELVFSVGGPNVWAVRDPHASRFEVCCAWGGKTARALDEDDYLGRLYSFVADN